jgi:hypothetical protein
MKKGKELAWSTRGLLSGEPLPAIEADGHQKAIKPTVNLSFSCGPCLFFLIIGTGDY